MSDDKQPSMVERVAKAILERDSTIGYLEAHELAKVAIATMRYPTEEMYQAAAMVGHDVQIGDEWAAMIEEALK